MKKQERDGSSDETQQHRQIISRPDDEHLFAFLADLFHLAPNDAQPGQVKSGADAMPERISLRTVFSVGGREDVGPVVHCEEWKPQQSAMLKTEQIVALSNRLLEKAQRDCASAGRPMRYTVQAFSHSKGAEAYARHLLALKPGGRELPMVPSEDEDDTSLRGQLKEAMKDKRFSLELMARMFTDYRDSMEGLIGKYESRLSQVEHVNSDLLRTHLQLIATKEELLDRKSARELRERKEVFWQSLTERAVGFAENMLPPMITALTNGKLGAAPGLGSFMDSLDQAQKDQLFGVFNERHEVVSPGLLTRDQIELFGALHDGKVPGSRIADFVASLSAEQIAGAQHILRKEQLAGLLMLAETMGRAQANGAAS